MDSLSSQRLGQSCDKGGEGSCPQVCGGEWHISGGPEGRQPDEPSGTGEPQQPPPPPCNSALVLYEGARELSLSVLQIYSEGWILGFSSVFEVSCFQGPKTRRVEQEVAVSWDPNKGVTFYPIKRPPRWRGYAKPHAKPSTKSASKRAAQVVAKPAVGKPIPAALVEHVQLFRVTYSRQRKWHTLSSVVFFCLCLPEKLSQFRCGPQGRGRSHLLHIMCSIKWAGAPAGFPES